MLLSDLCFVNIIPIDLQRMEKRVRTDRRKQDYLGQDIGVLKWEYRRPL